MKITLLLAFFMACEGWLRAVDVPLDPTASTLKFTGHAFMHDFNGEAKSFSGSASLDPHASPMVLGARIDVVTSKMTTFESTRDTNMYKWMQVDTNPKLNFILTKVTLLKGDPDHATKEHPAQFQAEGNFTLNAATKPLATQVLGWREGKWLVVTGAFKIDTTQFGLPIIRQLFLTVDKDVDVDIHLAFTMPPEWQTPAQS